MAQSLECLYLLSSIPLKPTLFSIIHDREHLRLETDVEITGLHLDFVINLNCWH